MCLPGIQYEQSLHDQRAPFTVSLSSMQRSCHQDGTFVNMLEFACSLCLQNFDWLKFLSSCMRGGSCSCTAVESFLAYTVPDLGPSMPNVSCDSLGFTLTLQSTCLLFLLDSSVADINTMTKSSIGGKGFIFLTSHIPSSRQASVAQNSRQKLGGRS